MRLLPALVAVLLVVGLLPAPGGAVTRTTAVLDRFEGDRAVLVTDSEQRLVLPRSAVPPAGRHVDAVFRVTLQDGRVVGLDYRPEESRERARRAQDRFDRLAEEPDPSTEQPGSERTGLSPRGAGCLLRSPGHRPAGPAPTPVRARPC